MWRRVEQNAVTLTDVASLERERELDLVYTVQDEMSDAGSPGELSRVRPQYPEPKTMLLLRRAHASQIARDVWIEVQRDQVRKVAFVHPLGGQLIGAQVFHGT